MITKNILYKYFEQFANNHLQIKDFGYGDLSEISSSQATQYPLFWVSPQPSSISGNEITYNFNILIGDRLEDGDGNKVEVESDTFQIGLDLLATLNINRDVDLDKNNTLTPFIHDFKDRIAGHLITLSVTADFDYNECAVPTTGTPTPPTSSCPVAIITINGVAYGSASSGGTEDISVVDGNGTPVGSLVSGNWVVTSTCSDATAVLKNSLGTTLSTTPIASGASANITAPDGSAVLKNTLNTTLSTTAIVSNVSSDITAPDSTITINSASFFPYPSGATSNIIVKDTLGSAVGSKVGTEWIVPSGSTPSGVLLQFPVGEQYTTYRTGDEGWRLQNGWYNYIAPTSPAVIAQLDRTAGANYWFKLKSAIKVGGNSNTIRFVDVDGLQAWGTTNNKDKITIDKLTGLGFYRKTADLGGTANWNNSIDGALSFSVVVNSITYSDFYLISREEILATLGEQPEAGSGWISDAITGQQIYVGASTSVSLWTGTTQSNSGGASAYIRGMNPSVYVTGSGKTGSTYKFYVFDATSLISAP